MSDPWTNEQTNDEWSTNEEPVVGGWGETFGDAPAQQEEQSVWDQVTDWFDDPTDNSSQEESSGIGGVVSDIVDGIWRPTQESIDRRNELEANHLSVFRGRLNSAIQATELLGPESTSDQVQSASGLITTAANTAYGAADELDRDTAVGNKYASYHGMLAWAASELEKVAWSNSETERQYSIPGILNTLRDVGNDSESLY